MRAPFVSCSRKLQQRMAFVQVSGISKKEEGRLVLHPVSFTQQPFEKVAVAGATGSGKTTLLKIIAGLTQPDSGHVHIAGERVLGPDEKLVPGHPGVAYLSQHFELRNNYRVAELLAMANQLTEKEAALIYAVCRIEPFLARWTHQLSGGERQRVALARLLVSAPALLLLDEPYSNLDAIHKTELKAVLQDISAQLQMTCCLVSHDPVDVLSWADTILVLQGGRLIQKGEPVYLYRYPVNEYVAALFGKYNMVPDSLLQALLSVSAKAGSISRFIRPEQLRLTANKESGIEGMAVQLRFMGGVYELEVLVSGTKLVITTNVPVERGRVVYVSLV
jgi:ABC-type Fe3+/spermidine/putrescine transport system ATPase subunit